MVAKISKWTFLFVFVLLPLHGVLSQEYKNLYFHKANKILYDLEGKALWADSLGYITLEGDIIAASDLLPVYFDKGKNGFSNYTAVTITAPCIIMMNSISGSQSISFLMMIGILKKSAWLALAHPASHQNCVHILWIAS